MSLVANARSCSFEHEAFVYDDDAEYATVLGSIITAAIEAGQPVVAVVSDRNARLLRGALGPRAEGVEWIDAVEWYRHPVRTIAAYERTLRGFDPDVGALVIGEVQFGDDEDDRSAWVRYEAALNDGFARFTARVICPYDTRALAPDVVGEARRTHPVVLQGEARVVSTDYDEPASVAARRSPRFPLPGDPPALDLRFRSAVRECRRAFAALASEAGFDPTRIEELTLGLSEVLSNAVMHGGGGGRLRVWLAGNGVAAVVDDDGDGVDDPLLGFRPPPTRSLGGYGMWIARRVFDRLELQPNPDGGLSVRLAADA